MKAFKQFLGWLLAVCLLVTTPFFVGRYSYHPAIAKHLPPALPGYSGHSPGQSLSTESVDQFFERFFRDVQAKRFDAFFQVNDLQFPTEEEQYTLKHLTMLSNTFMKVESYRIIKIDIRYAVTLRSQKGETRDETFRFERKDGRWELD